MTYIFIGIASPNMGVKQWWNEQSSGVKLLVGIGLVLGFVFLLGIAVVGFAIVGSFVVGVDGGGQATAPQAAFDCSFEDDRAVMTHNGGDALDPATITVEEASESDVTMPDGEMGPGDEIVVQGASEITLRWDDPDSDESAIIGECIGAP